MMENSNIYIEEDEIDLKELFKTIWDNKIKIGIFVFIITSLTIIYTLSIPNSYKSSTALIPQTQAKSSLGGLGALAGMAGIDIGGSSGLSVDIAFNTILNDFDFQKQVIEKHNLIKKLESNEDNLVFALGFDGIYQIFNGKSDNEEAIPKKDLIHNTYKSILNTISISADKKSGIINISAELTDRFLAKELVDIYLVELTSHLRKIEMQDVQTQINYYTRELGNTEELGMKDQLSQLASGLIQKRVLSMANEYYNVKQLTKPQVSHIKDKTKPKRGLIVVVSFITSFILGIFITFFIEFIRKDEEEK